MTSRLEIKVAVQDRLLSSSTSKGDQQKWHTGGKWLKANKFGYEDIAEFVASNLLKCSNVPVPYVAYGLCKIPDGTAIYNGCYSSNSLEDGETLITFARLFSQNLINTDEILSSKDVKTRVTRTISTIKNLTGLDITKYLRSILTLDAVIYNEDRHLSNLAIIFNERTGKYTPAPIFDNGLSILSDTHDYRQGIAPSILLRRVKARPFSSNFEKQMQILGSGFIVDKQKFLKFLADTKPVIGRAHQVMQISISEHPEILK